MEYAFALSSFEFTANFLIAVLGPNCIRAHPLFGVAVSYQDTRTNIR